MRENTFNFLSNKFEQVLDFVKGIETISEDSIQSILDIVKNVLIEANAPLSVINYFLDSLIKLGQYFLKFYRKKYIPL